MSVLARTGWSGLLTPDTRYHPSSVIQSHGPTWLAVEFFQGNKLYRLKPNCDGGLILQKRFYTELICPGSALGGTIDTAITGVFSFGSTLISEPFDPLDRQQAFQCRLNQSNHLKHLMQEQSPFHRTSLLLEQLQELVGMSEIGSIPAELLGQLIGLPLKRIETVRSLLLEGELRHREEECKL
ncbi:MAG: hypothetical protein AAGA40_07110 [Cyanobacteria bacterium P01_E01_bin.45]